MAAAVQTVDPASLRYRSRLWSFTAGHPATPLTDAGPWSDTLPRFSPDGAHLAFLSNRDGLRRVWITDGDGGGEPGVPAVLDGTGGRAPDGSGRPDGGGPAAGVDRGNGRAEPA